MQSYNRQQSIGTYTVNKSLIESLEEFLTKDVFNIVNIKPKESSYIASEYFHIIITDSYGQEKLSTINEYKQQFYRNDTIGITVEFKFGAFLSNEKELRIVIRFGKKQENCDLTISLTNEKAREQVFAIEKGVLTILDQHKNLNWIFYPYQPLNMLVGFVCFLAGVFAISDNKTKQERFISGSIFFLGFIYFIVCRYFKGYCTFDTRKQIQLNKWFNWFAFGFIGFLLFSTLLTSIRKELFGF